MNSEWWPRGIHKLPGSSEDLPCASAPASSASCVQRSPRQAARHAQVPKHGVAVTQDTPAAVPKLSCILQEPYGCAASQRQGWNIKTHAHCGANFLRLVPRLSCAESDVGFRVILHYARLSRPTAYHCIPACKASSAQQPLHLRAALQVWHIAEEYLKMGAGTVPEAAGSPPDLAFQPVKHLPLGSHCICKLPLQVWSCRLATLLLCSTSLLPSFVCSAHGCFFLCCIAREAHQDTFAPILPGCD